MKKRHRLSNVGSKNRSKNRKNSKQSRQKLKKLGSEWRRKRIRNPKSPDRQDLNYWQDLTGKVIQVFYHLKDKDKSIEYSLCLKMRTWQILWTKVKKSKSEVKKVFPNCHVEFKNCVVKSLNGFESWFVYDILDQLKGCVAIFIYDCMLQSGVTAAWILISCSQINPFLDHVLYEQVNDFRRASGNTSFHYWRDIIPIVDRENLLFIYKSPHNSVSFF